MEAGLFTYAGRWAGLPVVSVIHLYTGDLVVPLELVSWVALKGHRIPRLTAIATTTPIHWYARVPAGCRHRAWTERDGQRAYKEKEEQTEEKGVGNGKSLVSNHIYIYIRYRVNSAFKLQFQNVTAKNFNSIGPFLAPSLYTLKIYNTAWKEE